MKCPKCVGTGFIQGAPVVKFGMSYPGPMESCPECKGAKWLDGFEGRPKYETESDREREDAFAARIASATNLLYQKLPEQWRIDGMLLRRKDIAAWVELKIRTNPSGEYATYMIAVSKWRALWELESATGIPSVLAVAFTDGDFIIRVGTTAIANIQYAGRTQKTRDALDIEPVVYIGMESFKRIAPGQLEALLANTRIPA